ncbi:hypothetical protein ALC57_06384 [Trachymyrmex cornetzi]|uniref:CCHC-type domain-containing protein n=1 Tax=Trachymyrmex cornetzi TaxID=471704 RepID=A0A151J952_9HYME|nr:hypothetical protein ALC57_06384 [Trachymyrmex cornetzi]
MDFEDDELDRVDFFKISKKAGHGGLKKRKGLVECPLDDRLSSRQKDAIEEVTVLFPQMSPKSIMAETLRVLETAGEAERRTQSMKGDLRRQIKVGVNVAKVAVQRLVSEITKGAGPADEVRANNLALEKEIIKLRREMDALRRERTSLRDQLTDTSEVTRELGEDVLPPAYRPALRRSRRRLEDWPSLSTRVNENGRIVATGPLRLGRGGMNSVWVQCPLQCANKREIISERRMRIGWSSVGVVALAKRRLQCFRCLAVGHTRANCQSLVDRSTSCFQCGSDGHRAAECRLPPKCPVCASRGLAFGDRAGAPECTPFNGRGRVPKDGETRENVEGTSVGADRGAPTLANEPVNMEVDNG